MKFRDASELEVYEFVLAAYPDRFQEGEDDIWDEVMEFIEDELGGFELISELLGRVVMLTNPMISQLSKSFDHCLGTVRISDGQVHMMAAIKRPTSTR